MKGIKSIPSDHDSNLNKVGSIPMELFACNSVNYIKDCYKLLINIVINADKSRRSFNLFIISAT